MTSGFRPKASREGRSAQSFAVLGAAAKRLGLPLAALNVTIHGHMTIYGYGRGRYILQITVQDALR